MIKRISQIISIACLSAGCGTLDSQATQETTEATTPTADLFDDPHETDGGVATVPTATFDAGPESATNPTEDNSEGDASDNAENPFETGAFNWETIDHSADLSGQTQNESGLGSVNLSIYQPVTTSTRPVLILSPGFMLSPTDFASYGSHFASWGYVTLLVALPGNMLNPTDHATLALTLSDVIDWIQAQVDNSSSVLDTPIELTQIGLIGHSMGGKISLLTAANDDRVKAVFGIDPVDATGGTPGSQPSPEYPSVTPERMSDITIPIVLMGETTNSEGGLFTPACAPADNNFEQYYLHATGPALVIDVLAANHMSFLDNPACLSCLACPSGTDDPAQTKRLTQGFAISFFESVLQGNEVMKTQWLDVLLPENVDNGLITWESKNNF